MKLLKLTFFALFSIFLNVHAQDQTQKKTKKYRITSGVESSILQFAALKTTMTTPLRSIPRFSYFFNSGFDLEYVGRNAVHPFIGLHVKNIGLILSTSDSTRSKHRVYTLGTPLGLKFHIPENDMVLKFGIEPAIALNYKWKDFINGKRVNRGHEYFSDKVASFYPSLFAGFSVSGFSLTGSYYPVNFFNSSLLNANLFTFGIGLELSSDKSPINVNMKK